MDPITTGFMMAAVIGCIVAGARSFTPADFDHPTIRNGEFVGGDL